VFNLGKNSRKCKLEDEHKFKNKSDAWAEAKTGGPHVQSMHGKRKKSVEYLTSELRDSKIDYPRPGGMEEIGEIGGQLLRFRKS